MINSYVTDTQAIIHFMENRKSISTKINKIFEDADNGKAVIYIPAIVLTEILYLFEKKRIQTSIFHFKGLFAKSSNYVEQELNINILEQAFEINDIPELHDRIIAATARYLGIPLLTNDPAIINSKYCQTIY